MAVEEFQIDFAKSPVHEGGATLIALLAYPDAGDEDLARSRLHASLCALALRAQFEGHSDELTPQFMKPIHAFRALEEISKNLKTLERRLRDRMVAAHMAIAFLQLAAGKQPKLPADVKRFSINQMSELVLADAGQADPENVEARIWRPSLPVIHLAAAVAVLINLAEAADFAGSGIGQLLSSRPLIEAVVEEAQSYEALIESSPNFPKNHKHFIRLRLSGC